MRMIPPRPPPTAGIKVSVRGNLNPTSGRKTGDSALFACISTACGLILAHA